MSNGLRLQLHPHPLTICRLDAGEPDPGWASGAFIAMTRTPDELTVVCDAAAPPAEVRSEGPWRAYEVAGPLDFSLVGILATVAAALAEAEVSIFVLSTFDTDWILVRSADVGRATWALEAHGHTVTTTSSGS